MIADNSHLEAGKEQVYVQSLPGQPTGKWQVSNGGGSHPRWRADGRELFYLALDRTLMSVEVRDGPVFVSGTPKPLFKLSLATLVFAVYDAAPDGKSFYVVSPTGQTSAAPITIVENWRVGLGR